MVRYPSITYYRDSFLVMEHAKEKFVSVLFFIRLKFQCVGSSDTDEAGPCCTTVVIRDFRPPHPPDSRHQPRHAEER